MEFRTAFSSHKKLRSLSAVVLIVTLLIIPIQRVVAHPFRGTWGGISNFALRGWGNVNGLFLFELAAPQADGLPNRPPLPQPQEPESPPSKAEKEPRVARIQLNLDFENWIPSKQKFMAGAVPLDADDNAVHGLTAEWSTSDKLVVFITKDGRAVVGRPGTARLTDRAGTSQLRGMTVDTTSLTATGSI